MNDPQFQHGKRFKTKEDGLEALRTGDSSKAVPYGGKEYEEAPYEFKLVFNQAAIRKEFKKSREQHTKQVRSTLP